MILQYPHLRDHEFRYHARFQDPDFVELLAAFGYEVIPNEEAAIPEAIRHCMLSSPHYNSRPICNAKPDWPKSIKSYRGKLHRP